MHDIYTREGKDKKNGFGEEKKDLRADPAPVAKFLYNVHIGCAYHNMTCKLGKSCFNCLVGVSKSFSPTETHVLVTKVALSLM